MLSSIDLKGRTALITGASSGIGAAIAGTLAGNGMRVALASRSEEKLRAVATGLPKGSESMIVPTDVGDEEDVCRMIEETTKRFGAIDLLVNSAGFGIFKPVIDLTAEEFDNIIRVNLRGSFLCMKYVLPQMYERESGTVINVSSVAGKHGFAGGSAYCSSKFGLMGLTECVFQEARAHNVRIVTISPGSVDTAFFDEAHTTSPNREKILQPDDVAQTVLLAISLPARALLRELDIRPTNPR